MRRQSLPGPERWNYRVGEWVRVRLGRDPKGPLRFRCGGVERTLPAARLLEFIAPSPGGLLQIVSKGDERAVRARRELPRRDRDATCGDQAAAEAGALRRLAALRAESGPESDPLFWVLLAIGGTAMVANWCLLAPGRGPRDERA